MGIAKATKIDTQALLSGVAMLTLDFQQYSSAVDTKIAALTSANDDGDAEAVATAITDLATLHASFKPKIDALQDKAAAVDPAAASAGTDTTVTAVSAPVVLPTTSPAQVVTVTGVDQPAIGSGVAGPGIADGTTVAGLQPSTTPGQTTIVLSDTTTDDHKGDGSEALTITPPAAS